jgi:DNA-binding NarL/FixJ family response regulator
MVAIRKAAHELTCVLAENHEQLLDASEHLLQERGVRILGKSRTGIGVLQILEAQPVTVVVVDLRLPDLDGLEVARRVAEITRRKTAVIIHASHADEQTIGEALDAGARAIVLKGGSPEHLLAALDSIAAEKTYIDPRFGLVGSEPSS